MNSGNKPIKNFIGNRLANKKILDLGCGDCSFIGMFDDVDKDRYFGLELDEERVRIAQNKGYNAKTCNLEAKKLPFEKENFDVVIVKDILEHLYNFVGLIEESRRVLKNRGILFISVPSEWSQLLWDDYDHKRGFTLNSIRELLAKLGFVIIRDEKYQDLIKFKTSRLKYPMRYIFKVLTGIDFITQGYLVEARKRE